MIAIACLFSLVALGIAGVVVVRRERREWSARVEDMVLKTDPRTARK
jgi:hypothetical protein